MSNRRFTVTMDTPGLLEHIEAKLAPPRPECLIWPGAVDRGYGRVWVDGKAKRVHRVVWELKHGPIPEGLTIDHLCRIRSCCNTEHMELVPQSENTKRAQPFRLRPLGARQPEQKKTLRIAGIQCVNGHLYTPESTVQQRDGSRRCLTCRAENNRQYNERRRAQRVAARELADTG